MPLQDQAKELFSRGMSKRQIAKRLGKGETTIRRWLSSTATEYNRYSTKSRAKKNKQFIDELKENIPCADCHMIYPTYVMDFDHINPQNKLFSISKIAGKSRKSILVEIEKCELVCSNCHRIREHSRRVSNLKM